MRAVPFRDDPATTNIRSAACKPRKTALSVIQPLTERKHRLDSLTQRKPRLPAQLRTRPRYVRANVGDLILSGRFFAVDTELRIRNRLRYVDHFLHRM